MPACAVVYCSSRSERGNRLFSLPQGERNKERRNIWIKNINRTELPTNLFICEKHFEEDQFENNRKDGRRPLKYNAIPTIFVNKRIKLEDKLLKHEDKPGTLPLKRSRRSLRILKPKIYHGYVSEDDLDEIKKEIKICGKKVRCRACLAVIEESSAHILKKQLNGKPIKDRLLLFVPQLTPSLLDTEYVCDKCCRLLQSFFRFYESCLVTDMKLKIGEISLTVDEEGKEESQDGKSTKITIAQFVPQKGARKRKQDLVSVRNDKVVEVQDNSDEENSQEDVLFKKRGRPRKAKVSQDEIAVVEDITKPVDLRTNATSQNEESVKQAVSNDSEEVNLSKDVITDEDKETTLDVNVGTEEKENKSNLNEPEKKSDCDNKVINNTNSIIVADHDYVNGMFHCPECQTDYRTSKGMRKHLISHHNVLEEHEFNCTRCSMQFIRLKDMLKHKQNYGSPCDWCDKIFSNSDELKSHKNNHPEAYYCLKCGRVFKQEDMLNKHSLLHDAMTKALSAIRKSEVANNCGNCGMVFATKQRLLDHLKTVHMKIKDIKCTECEKLFSTKSLMSSHLRLRHSENKPHQCDTCETAFKRPDHLALHKLTHNFSDPNRRTYGRPKDNAGKIFECPFCYTISSNKQLLTTHLSIHANERKFECTYCGLKLSSMRTQKMHEKTHEADPNCQFVCITCRKKFSTEEDLNTHELKHVPNLKRYSCCLCGAHFFRKLMLENHLLDLHIKGPDVVDDNVDKSIEIIDDSRKNNNEQSVDKLEEGEIIFQDVESADIVETEVYEENKIDEPSSMEDRINTATFIIIDEKDVCIEEC